MNADGTSRLARSPMSAQSMILTDAGRPPLRIAHPARTC